MYMPCVCVAFARIIKLCFDFQLPSVMEPIMDAVEGITNRCLECLVSMSNSPQDQHCDNMATLGVRSTCTQLYISSGF